MRFHVTGINHSKGSHMALDVDAPSKAAAEKKANEAGMDVQHIHVADEVHRERQTHRGEDAQRSSGWVIKVLIAVVIVVVIAVWVFVKLRVGLRR
jgi:hypothetical protein